MDGNPWYYDIKQFIQHHKYPLGASNTYMKTLRRLAMEYYLDVEVLYKISSDGTLLRCLDGIKAKKVLKEAREEIFATHANGHMMASGYL
jgi:adenine C2-methylase RlmN of 23S rRNA A2503 and tRNA A37